MMIDVLTTHVKHSWMNDFPVFNENAFITHGLIVLLIIQGLLFYVTVYYENPNFFVK